MLVNACNSKPSFKLNFIVDNEIYATVDTSGKELISMPQDPIKEKYTFEGWYWDKDVWKNEFTPRSLLDTPLSSNMEVYAHFVDDSYLMGTDIDIKGATKLTIDGIGDVFYLTLRNNQVVCKFDDYVRINPKTTYTLSTELSGNNVITSKTVELTIGDNPLYYIYVTDKNQKHETYIVLIHRNYIFNVSFNTNGGSSCESQKIEEGYKLENVPTSSKTGYKFNGWDYDFNEPIKANVIANAQWTANQYEIEFNVNGGDPLSSNKLTVTYDRSFTLPTPTRLGYEFAGWYNGNTKISSGNWNYLENMTLTAHWDVITYSITYNLNGGSAAKISLQNTYTVEDEITIQSPEKTGYNFTGWATSKNGNGTVNYKINKGTTGNLTFFAQWEAKKYTITYDVNGGDPLDNDTQEVTYDENYTLTTPTRLGYSFDGWYNGDTRVNDGTWSTDGDISLTAHWTLLTYKITYHLNGGSTSVQYPTTYNVNDLGKDDFDSVLINDQPEKTGYSFDGLFDDVDFSKPYTSFKNQTWVGDKDVYFKWNPNKYTITFNVNGGDALDSNTMDVYYDANYILPVPTRPGYSFQGWYNNSEKVIDGVWTRLDNLSLTAKWSINTYRITYELNGGINDNDNPSVFTYEDETIVLKDPTRTGYTFLGWTSEGVESPKKNFEITHNSTGNITVVANWQANKYTITFDANGGSGLVVASIEVEFDSSVVLPVLTKIGYTFKGWYNGASKYESGIWKTPNDITLTAQWDIINFNINYELDGGTNNPQNPTTYTYESDDVVLQDPSKDGYTFLGWTSLEISSPTKNVIIPKHSLGEKTFTANWKVNTYTITYDVNGGDTLDNDTQKIVYGDEYALKTPTRKGYVFVGWYYNGVLFESGVWHYTSDVLLIAHWNVIEYTINYVLNNGTNSDENPYAYTVDDEFVFQDPSRPGYSFEGWFNENGDRVYSVERGTIGSLTLIARWSPILNNLVVLSSNVSNGTVRIVSGSGYTDEQITIEATPKTNCVFRGWYSNNNLVSKKLEFSFVMPANDYSIVALFVTDQQNEWDIAHGVVPTSIDESTITYGLYPKTHVSDDAIINALDSIEESEENGWYLYNNEYYAKQKTILSTSTNHVLSFDDGTKIQKDKTYWFKCEPIEWIVVSSNDNNEHYLLSKYLLDAGAYLYNTGTGLYSDYERSSIRNWLNNDFLNSAFYLNREALCSYSFEHESKPLSNAFNDFVILPKYAELYSYATECIVTEYGRTRGGWYNSAYDLSEAVKKNKYWTSTTYSNSEVVTVESGSKWFCSVRSENVCIRPAIIAKF